MLFAGLALAGLVVLGACSLNVFLAVRELGRELERTRRRLAPKQADLRREVKRLERTRE